MGQGPRALKIIVIGMGAGIIGLTILIVMVIIDKAGNSIADNEPASVVADYADVAVALPAGATVMTMTGSDDALSLLMRLADGSQQITTINRRTGEVLGTLELMPRNP